MRLIRTCSILLLCALTASLAQAQEKSSGRKKDAAKKPTPFQKNLAFNAISFSVNSPGTDSGNTVTITPKGLKVDNTIITLPIEGKVQDILFGDIDSDSWPELIVWVAGNGKSPAIIHGYTVNNGLNLRPFTTSSLNLKEGLTEGLNGQEEYQIGNNVLMYRFPIFKGSKKTGKTRQLQYSLLTTDDAKQLWFERSSEY